MNDEERERVISENNNAQNMLIGLLNQITSTNIQELQINDVLHGDLDFSVLQDRGFKNVKTIIIDKPGEITNLFNIPDSVTSLTCKDQLLVNVDQIPLQIEDIKYF